MQPVRIDSSPYVDGRKAKRRQFPVLSHLRQYGIVSSFFLFNLAMAMPCLLFSFVAKGRHRGSRTFIQKAIAWWLNTARLVGALEIDFPDAAELRKLRGTIVVCNHPSLIDALILLSVLPDAVCIMRGDLSGSLVLGPITRMAGYVPNDSGRAMVREGSRTLKQGGNLLVFPEGTRTRSESVNIFKKGFALVAEKSDAPIQTVLIEREGLYLSKHCSVWKPADLPRRFKVHLGEVFRAEKRERPQELACRVESYFMRRLVNDGTSIRLAQSEAS